MPIKKRLAQVAATKSGSTHGGNDEKLKIEEGDHKTMNHMAVDTLTDPEDYTGGSTHTSVTAAAESVNVSTLPNDEDPAAGYLENAAADEEELDDEEEVDASFDVDEEDALTNNNGPTPLTAEEGEEGDDAPMADDWDAPPPDAEEDAEEDIEDAEESTGEEEEAAPMEPEDMAPEGEDLPLLDVDETSDTEVKDVAFASFGTRLMVIKANRIIATMTQRMAIASNRNDVYLTEQFQEVTASELAKKGLRKGLKSMGFALAKVNVSKQAVVNARVTLQASKQTAAVRKVTATKEAAFQQSLTIAAVGINRRYFNDVPNELKAHLETELQRAGMRGGAKVLQRAFAAYGPAYAKAIVELANKISEMPQESRDGFVSALDLTSEDMDTEDVMPMGEEAEAHHGEEDEDDFDEYEQDTIESSLATAGTYRKSVTASVAPAGHYSLAASAILNGDKPLFG